MCIPFDPYEAEDAFEGANKRLPQPVSPPEAPAQPVAPLQAADDGAPDEEAGEEEEQKISSTGKQPLPVLPLKKSTRKRSVSLYPGMLIGAEAEDDDGGLDYQPAKKPRRPSKEGPQKRSKARAAAAPSELGVGEAAELAPAAAAKSSKAKGKAAIISPNKGAKREEEFPHALQRTASAMLALMVAEDIDQAFKNSEGGGYKYPKVTPSPS